MQKIIIYSIMSEPSKEILLQFFKSSCSFLEKAAIKKIYDVNTWRNNVKGSLREFDLENIHKLAYAHLIIPNVSTTERVGTTFEVQLSSMNRVSEVFGSSLVRFHHNGDTTLVTPWAHLTANLKVEDVSAEEAEEFDVEKGAIVFPISIKDDVARVFIPCGGPDPETDTLPTFVRDVKVSELSTIDEDRLPATKAKGLSSKISAGENWFVAEQQSFLVGDTIVFKGEKVKVSAVSIDFRSDEHNCVRVVGEFKRNHARQAFKIVREPVLQGNVCNVPVNMLNLYNFFSVKHNIHSDMIGDVCVKYYNVCFNAMGFITHDTAVVL